MRPGTAARGMLCDRKEPPPGKGGLSQPGEASLPSQRPPPGFGRPPSGLGRPPSGFGLLMGREASLSGREAWDAAAHGPGLAHSVSFLGPHHSADSASLALIQEAAVRSIKHQAVTAPASTTHRRANQCTQTWRVRRGGEVRAQWRSCYCGAGAPMHTHLVVGSPSQSKQTKPAPHPRVLRRHHAHRWLLPRLLAAEGVRTHAPRPCPSSGPV